MTPSRQAYTAFGIFVGHDDGAGFFYFTFTRSDTKMGLLLGTLMVVFTKDDPTLQKKKLF